MYSHVSLNKIQLNISSPEGSQLRLNKGEILKGQVKDVKDSGLILIYLKGRLIEALSEVMVKPGDMLYLMVEDFREGKAYLKVLTPENLNRLENDVLALRLKEMGISPREDDILAAKTLIQYHLPLTKENMRNIAAGAKMLGEINNQNLALAAFALAKGIPLNKEILGLLAYQIDKNTNLAKLIDSVLKMAVLPEGKAVLAGSDELDGLWTKGNTDALMAKGEGNMEAGREETWLAGMKNSGTTDKIPLVKSESSLPEENDAAGLKTELTGSVKPVKQEQADNFKFPERWRPLLGFLQNLLEEVRINPAGLNDNKLLVFRMKEYLAAEKDFIQVLSQVLETASKEADIKENRAGLDFLKTLDYMKKEISSYQLFNSISQKGMDPHFNYYYFAWPVRLDETTHLLELRIDREKKGQDIAKADSLSIAVALDTPRMGKVLFHINWMKKYKIELRGVVETLPVKEYIEKNIAELVSALTGLGYQVNYLGTKVAQNREEMVISQVKLEEVRESVKPFRIDVTV